MTAHDHWTLFAYQSGMSVRDELLSPGNLSVMAMLRDAIAAGCRRVDLLRGTETYKFSWTAHHRPARTTVIRQPSVAGHVGAWCDIAWQKLKRAKERLSSPPVFRTPRTSLRVWRPRLSQASEAMPPPIFLEASELCFGLTDVHSGAVPKPTLPIDSLRFRSRAPPICRRLARCLLALPADIGARHAAENEPTDSVDCEKWAGIRCYRGWVAACDPRIGV